MSSIEPQYFQKLDQSAWDKLMDETCPVKTDERRKQMRELSCIIQSNKDHYKSPNGDYIDTGR